MGIGSSKPRDRDTRLRDRSAADDNDDDNDLDRRGDVVAPNGNIYQNVGAPLDATEQTLLEHQIQATQKALAKVAAVEAELADANRKAGLQKAPPSAKGKAAKIAAILLGGAVLGAGITVALFLGGVFQTAEKIVTVPVPVNNPPPPAPGEAEFTKVVQSFVKLPESDFWPAYKTVIDQFEAGLEVQKLVATYIVKITTPNYFKSQGVDEFGTKANYQAAAKAILAKIMDNSNKDPLLAYDEVAKALKADLLLGRPSLEAEPDVVRTLRAGLLIVVLDLLMEANT